MKKIAVFLVATVALLLLSSCEFNMSADFYMQDAIDVLETENTLYTNATFAFEFGGDEEDKQEAIDFLSARLYEADNFREETQDYQTYMLVDYKIPLVYADAVETLLTNSNTQQSIFALAITKDGNILNTIMVFNQKKFDELNTALYEQFYHRMEFEEATIVINLNNDLHESVEVTVFAAYVDNMPVPYSGTFLLERRDDIEIRLSDVLKDSFGVQLESDSNDIRIRKFAEIAMTPE